MLPADACVAPDRSLVVAVHSGGPDWGSGPSGEGKLYKVTYEERDDAPIPSLVWAESPREVRIAFDRPVDPATLKDLAKRISIDGGEFVGAGDRFESFRPGYAVVERQMNSPRFGVEVQGVQLTADRRTLIVTTAPQTLAVNYGVSLPGIVETNGIARSQRRRVIAAVSRRRVAIRSLRRRGDVEPDGRRADSTFGLPHLDFDASQGTDGRQCFSTTHFGRVAASGAEPCDCGRRSICETCFAPPSSRGPSWITSGRQRKSICSLRLASAHQ